MSHIEKNVHVSERSDALNAEYQNLNSGRRRTNGLNSSESCTGSAGSSDGSRSGSSCGDRNPMNR